MSGAVHKLHFIWIQGEEHLQATRPDLYVFVQTWRRHFYDWDVRVWNEADIVDLLRVGFPPSYLSAYTTSPRFAMKSDIARCAIVFAQGGMYADTDMECLKRFAHFLEADKPSFVYCSDTSALEARVFNQQVNNMWFYAPKPGFPGFLLILENAVAVLHSASAGTLKKCSISFTFNVAGPAVMQRVILGPMLQHVHLLSSPLLDPVNANVMHKGGKTGDAARVAFPYAYALHHADNSWVDVPQPLVKGIVCMWGRYRESAAIIGFIFMLTTLCLSIALAAAFVRRRPGPATLAMLPMSP